MLITGIFKKFKFSKFLQTHFSSPIPIKMKKKIAQPGVVCHGLQENAFQVNQLYNVTWSNLQTSLNPLLMTTAMRDIQVERLGERRTQRCGK